MEFMKTIENKSAFINACVKEHIEREKQMTDGDLPQIGQSDRRLPFYDARVACGVPTDVGDVEPAELMTIDSLLNLQVEDSRVFTVQGESMLGAGIYPGDILIIDIDRRSPNRHIPMLCRVNGENTVKYVEEHEGQYRLIPANDAYSPIEIEPDDDFAIIGQVLWNLHRHTN